MFSFPVPRLPSWLPVVVSVVIVPLADRASGYQVSYSLDGGDEGLRSRLSQLLSLQKMEAVLGAARDVRMVIRWAFRAVKGQGAELWAGSEQLRPAWPR